MSETSMMILGGRRRRPGRRPGRPRAKEPGASVCAWLAASEHDKLIAKANEHDMSVSAYVRTVLRKEISNKQR